MNLCGDLPKTALREIAMLSLVLSKASPSTLVILEIFGGIHRTDAGPCAMTSSSNLEDISSGKASPSSMFVKCLSHWLSFFARSFESIVADNDECQIIPKSVWDNYAPQIATQVITVLIKFIPRLPNAGLVSLLSRIVEAPHSFNSVLYDTITLHESALRTAKTMSCGRPRAGTGTNQGSRTMGWLLSLYMSQPYVIAKNYSSNLKRKK